MTTENTAPSALDLLREFVTDCERPYSDAYLAAAGVRPAPADPQQVADRIEEDTGWHDLARTYLKARRFLDAPPPAPRPGSVGAARDLEAN